MSYLRNGYYTDGVLMVGGDITPEVYLDNNDTVVDLRCTNNQSALTLYDINRAGTNCYLDINVETTFDNNVNINGNFTLTGDNSYINVDKVRIGDPLLILGNVAMYNESLQDTRDIGFLGEYLNLSNETKYAGLFRDADNKKFYLVNDINHSITHNNTVGAINTGNYADIHMGNTTINGSLIVDGDADFNVNDFFVDANRTISLDALGSSNFTVSSNDLSNQVLTIAVTNVGAGTGILDIDTDGDINVDSSDGDLNVGTNADIGTINVGTGASARTINIGNDASTKVDVNALDIELDSTGSITINATTTLDIDSTGNTNIDASGYSSINIGHHSDQGPINIGTSGTARVISIGNDSSSVIDMNSLDVFIDAGDEVNINATNTFNLNTDSGTINIGTDAVAQTINIGEDSITAINIDATTFSLDGYDNSNIGITTDDASDKTLTISATNAGVGNAIIQISADEQVLVSGQTVLQTTTNSFSKDTGTLVVKGGVGIEKDVWVGCNLFIEKDTTVFGNLTVFGNQTSLAVETNTYEDPLLILSNAATNDIFDIGFLGAFVNGTGSRLFSGIYRDATDVDKTFKLVDNLVHDPGESNIVSGQNNTHLAALDTGSHYINGSLTVDGGDIDFNVCNVMIDANCSISLDAYETSNFTVTANDASDQTLSIGITNTGAGDGILDIDTDGDINVDSSGGDINVGTNANEGAINIGTGASGRIISIGNDTSSLVDINALDVFVDAGDQVDINAGCMLTMSAGCHITLDAEDEIYINGTQGVNINTNTGDIDIGTNSNVNGSINIGDTNTTDNVNIGGEEVNVDASSNFNVDADNEIYLNSTNNIFMNTNDMTVNVTCGIEIDAGCDMSLESNANIYINGSDGINIDTTDGDIDIGTNSNVNGSINIGDTNTTDNVNIGGEEVNIDASSNFNVDADNEIYLNSTNNIFMNTNDMTVNVTCGIEIDAGCDISLESDATIYINGSDGINIDTTDGDINIGTNSNENGSIYMGTNETDNVVINASVIELNGVEIIINSSTFTINTTDNLSIESSQTIYINASEDIEMDADCNIKITTGCHITNDADFKFFANGTLGVQVDSSSGDIDIGTNADTGSINVGTGASARTVTIGNDASTKVDINALDIELDSGGPITMDAVTSISLNTLNNQNINIGTDATSTTINIGNEVVQDIIIKSESFDVRSSETSNIHMEAASASDHQLSICANNSGSGNASLRLCADEKLYVQGGNNSQVRFNDNGHDVDTIFVGKNNATLLYIKPSEVDAIQPQNVRTHGGVGIGKEPNGFSLDLRGNMRIEGLLSTPSDRRLKTNIETIPDVLHKLDKIRGVYYKWNKEIHPDKNIGDELQIGVIAQEIEAQYPELIITDNSGYKSVAYDRLPPILLQGMKEQQIIIDKIKEDNSHLDLSKIITKEEAVEQKKTINKLIENNNKLLESNQRLSKQVEDLSNSVNVMRKNMKKIMK